MATGVLPNIAINMKEEQLYENISVELENFNQPIASNQNVVTHELIQCFKNV